MTPTVSAVRHERVVAAFTWLARLLVDAPPYDDRYGDDATHTFLEAVLHDVPDDARQTAWHDFSTAIDEKWQLEDGADTAGRPRQLLIDERERHMHNAVHYALRSARRG